MSMSRWELERLRVLMVNTCQSGGGAGRAGQLLATALRHRGHHVDAIVASNPTHDPSCRRALHWRISRLMQRLHARGFPEIGNLLSFVWGCRDDYAGADLLHLHNLHGEYLSIAALPLWALDKPIVWTLHDFWALTGNCATPRDCTRWRAACGRCPMTGVYPMAPVDRTRLYRWLKPRLFAAARPYLTIPSHWLADRVREVPFLRRLPQRLIRYPIDCDLFRPLPDRDGLRRKLGLRPAHPTVVMAGNNWADRLKGGDQAITALRAALSGVPDLQLLIVGQGSDRVLAGCGLPGRALGFLEQRQSLVECYACADLCLFPSRADNYPLTILEALACGTPVVAYDVGGIPEQIEQGRTGFLAHDGHPEELAAAVVRLATDHDSAREMGRAGREFVLRTSSVPIIVEQYEQVYRQAIRSWAARRGRVSPRRSRGRLALWLACQLGWEEQPRPAELLSPQPSAGCPSRGKPVAATGGGSGPSAIGAGGHPMISVVTPSYNQGAYIERCIRSVLAQNYPNFEHIIYDNCSTDGTLEVLRRYPHLDWISEPDAGQSDALNKAIHRSRGEIIAWINADDYYEPGAFAVAARELRRETGVMVIAGAINLVGPDGRVLRTLRPRFHGLDYLVDFWSHPHYLYQQALLFRREAIERAGLLDPRLHYAMDYDLWLRLAEHFDIKVVDQVLASFVLLPDTKSGRSRCRDGFRQELERISRRYWGPIYTPRRWKLARACNRYLAQVVIHAIVDQHKRGAGLDWPLVAELLWRRPVGILNRHVLAVLGEQLVGPGRWEIARQLLRHWRKTEHICSRWRQETGRSAVRGVSNGPERCPDACEMTAAR